MIKGKEMVLKKGFDIHCFFKEKVDFATLSFVKVILYLYLVV